MKLIQTLGTFYQDNPEVKELTSALDLLEDQTTQEKREMIDSLSRHDIPPFRTEKLYPIRVNRTPVLKKYDGKQAYDFALPYDFSDGTTEVVLPEEIKSFAYWTDGINQYAIKEEYSGNTLNVPDDVKTIWLRNALIDHNDLFTQFGYIFDLSLPSSEDYKLLLNAMMDSLVNGPSEASVMLALSAMTGIPVARYDNETVLSVHSDYIETDHGIYRNGEPDRWTVRDGDILYKGQPMCDGIEVTDDVPALQLGQEYTGLCDPITFVNKDIPTQTKVIDGNLMIDLDDDILTRLTHERGIALAEKVTDPCEISRIHKLLDMTEEKPEEVTTGSGLGTYMVTRRFN